MLLRPALSVNAINSPPGSCHEIQKKKTRTTLTELAGCDDMIALSSGKKRGKQQKNNGKTRRSLAR